MKKKKDKRWIKISIGLIVAVAVVVGGVFLWNQNKDSGKSGNSTRTFQTQAVTKNNLSVDVSGSGTLKPAESETIKSSYSGTVTKVNKKVGDTVKSGEVIATISSDELDSKIKETQNKLDSVGVQIASTDSATTTKYITSSVGGKVKNITASSGDVAEDMVEKNGYLCLISTDGKMQVTFTSSKTVKKYAELKVKVGSSSETGTVTAVNGKEVTVQISDNSYTIGKTASVYTTGGTKIGSGKLNLVDYVAVKETDGKVSSVLVEENETVYKGTSLFKLEDYTSNSNYQNLKSQKEELENQLKQLTQQKTVTVEFNGTIADLPISKGDSTSKDDTICTVNGKKGFTLNVDVDELDISDVKLGDEAKITLDAVDGNFKGNVSYISNVGNTDNSVTTYKVTITTDAIEGAMSGMNATAKITTQSSGESLVVPVNAVQTNGDENFVYLAPKGSQKGDEVDQSTVNKEDLTKVTVKTGMSNGSSIVVEGNGLSEGTLIFVPVITTNSESSGNTNSNRMQGMFGSGMQGGPMQGGQGSGQMPNGMGNRKSGSSQKSGN